MKRVVIYGRVSTQDQETENQIAQLKRYVEVQTWELGAVITDSVSGGKGIDARKGLEQVFSMAHKRQFDVLLFWSLDRLTREGSRKTIEYLSRLESLGVDWHSYTELYLSSLGVFKDAIIAILSALARQEKIRIGERTKAGMERWRRLHPGQYIGRPKTSRETMKEVISLKQQGLSLTEIGNRMNVTAARICQIAKMGQQLEGVK